MNWRRSLFLCHHFFSIAIITCHLKNVLHLRFHIYYSIHVYCTCISSLCMTGLPWFLRRGNMRNWFPLCSYAFTIKIFVWHFKMFYIWGCMHRGRNQGARGALAPLMLIKGGLSPPNIVNNVKLHGNIFISHQLWQAGEPAFNTSRFCPSKYSKPRAKKIPKSAQFVK